MPSNYHLSVHRSLSTPTHFSSPFQHSHPSFSSTSTSAGTCRKFMLEASTITSSPSSGSSGGRSSGSVGPNGSSKGGTKSNLAGDVTRQAAGCRLFFQEEAAPKNCTLQGSNRHISHQTGGRMEKEHLLKSVLGGTFTYLLVSGRDYFQTNLPTQKNDNNKLSCKNIFPVCWISCRKFAGFNASHS